MMSYDNLINLYYNYYDTPNEENRDALTEEILRNSIPCPINIIPSFTQNGDNSTLISNGSTYNVGTRYKFGPYPEHWIYKIERKLRGNGVIVCINSPLQFLSSTISNKCEKIKNHPQYDFILTCDVRYNHKTILEDLYNIYLEFGPINLVTHPHIWLYVFSNQEYIESFNIKWIKSITNTDSDLFFKTNLGFYINDQMVNWQTGINFYTCQYGKKHSLPIFHQHNHINLLNQNTINKNDDIYKANNNAFLCNCGKEAIEFEFIPHKNNQIQIDETIYRPLELANKLNSNYINLQFHQIDDTIDIYYSTGKYRMTKEDKEIVKHCFKKFKTRFYPNSLFYIGRKIITFWKGPNPCVIENKSHHV